MLIQIDYNKFKENNDTVKESFECIHMAIHEHCKKLQNPKLIYSEGLAYLFEGWDSGPHGDFKYIKETISRCERGYYADFYVASCIKDNTVIICHDNGVDAIEVTGFDTNEL